MTGLVIKGKLKAHLLDEEVRCFILTFLDSTQMLLLASLIPFILGVFFVVCIWLLLHEINKQNQYYYDTLYNQSTSNSRRDRRTYEQIFPASQLNFTNPHPLKSRLLMMLGNTATLERLLQLAIRDHPGNSEQWYYEKVLYDLERDRRR